MINLLPPETKQNIIFGRHNRRLVQWIGILFAAISGIVLLVFGGRWYIQHSVATLDTQVNQTRDQLKVQKLDETQARVEAISSNLKLVISVLSRQILFSKLIQQIGAALPANTALTNLQISKTQGGIDLSAVAADYQAATQIQVNLQDANNKIFEKADILNITCVAPVALSTTSAANPTVNNRYPCQVQVRALFSANNPYLFITPKAAPGVAP